MGKPRAYLSDDAAGRDRALQRIDHGAFVVVCEPESVTVWACAAGAAIKALMPAASAVARTDMEALEERALKLR